MEGSRASIITKTTVNGLCHGCREGRVGEKNYGFALCVIDGQPPRWYCLYCGTDEVCVIDDEPTGVEECVVLRAHSA